jgi:hypothetical protein
MRMTASWFRPRRAYRIQGCGAMFAPAGKLRLGHTRHRTWIWCAVPICLDLAPCSPPSRTLRAHSDQALTDGSPYKGALRGSPRRRGCVGDRSADQGEGLPLQAFQIAAP